MTATAVIAAALCVIALAQFASFVLMLADVLGRATERLEASEFRDEALKLQVKQSDLMQRNSDALTGAACDTGKLFGKDSPKGH